MAQASFLLDMWAARPEVRQLVLVKVGVKQLAEAMRCTVVGLWVSPGVPGMEQMRIQARYAAGNAKAKVGIRGHGNIS